MKYLSNHHARLVPMSLKSLFTISKLSEVCRDGIYAVRLTRYLLLLTFLLSACSLSQEPAVIYVTATPQAVLDGPSPVPPTPTIPPTPTVPPEVAIQLANQYLTNGYYEKAVAAYQDVLANSTASPTVAASAGYGLGRSALLEGLFQ